MAGVLAICMLLPACGPVASHPSAVAHPRRQSTQVGEFTVRVTDQPRETFLSGSRAPYALLERTASGASRTVASISCARRPFITYAFPEHVVVRCQAHPFADFLVDTATGVVHLLWSAGGQGVGNFAYEKMAFAGQGLAWVVWSGPLRAPVLSEAVYNLSTGAESPLPAPFQDLAWYDDRVRGGLFSLSGTPGHLALWALQVGHPRLVDPGPLPNWLAGVGPGGTEWFAVPMGNRTVLTERSPGGPMRRTWTLDGREFLAGAGWVITGSSSGSGPEKVFFPLQHRTVTVYVNYGQRVRVTSKTLDAVMLP